MNVVKRINDVVNRNPIFGIDIYSKFESSN